MMPAVPCQPRSGKDVRLSPGRGSPLLFLHGWGVGPQSYRAPLELLSKSGFQILAPAQPGFSGTPPLGRAACSFEGYASWVAEHLESLGATDPMPVIGHSFGAGVAIQLAHDYPELVRSLVLCNAVGGPVRSSSKGDWRPMSRRPLWDWGVELGADLLALPALPKVLPAVLEEAVPNLFHNPLALARVAAFVRRADLVAEAHAVAARGTPLALVWSDRDRLVPHGSFAALCDATGTRGIVAHGQHSWLIAQPEHFADIALRVLAESGAIDAVLPQVAQAV